MTKTHQTRETKRALSFAIKQIKKGWTPEEVLNQVETSYGWFIKANVLYFLERWCADDGSYVQS